MTVLTAALTRTVCRLLSSDEREIIEGDFAELHITGAPALREILALIGRRCAAPWAGWRPWLALGAIALPFGFLLSVVSRWWAEGAAIDAFVYIHSWTWLQLTIPGARHLLLATTARSLEEFLALAGWSWTVGVVAGALSRRTTAATVLIFALVFIGIAVGTTTTARVNPYNAGVFGAPFYGRMFPMLASIGLVFVPALLGIRQSAPSRRPALLRTAVVAIAIVVLTASSAGAVESSLTFGLGRVPANLGPHGLVGAAEGPGPLVGVPIVLVWPALYVLGDAIRRQHASRITTA